MQTATTTYPAPADLADCEARMADLHRDIQQIEVQLGDHNRLNAAGERMTHAEWNTWRISAKIARNRKLDEYRWLKAWRTAERNRQHEASRQ